MVEKNYHHIVCLYAILVRELGSYYSPRDVLRYSLLNLYKGEYIQLTDENDFKISDSGEKVLETRADPELIELDYALLNVFSQMASKGTLNISNLFQITNLYSCQSILKTSGYLEKPATGSLRRRCFMRLEITSKYERALALINENKEGNWDKFILSLIGFEPEYNIDIFVKKYINKIMEDIQQSINFFSDSL